MTTLPPEANDDHGTEPGTGDATAPQAPQAPQADAPGAPQAPAAPEAPQAPEVPDAAAVPPPAAPQYQAPPPGAPQYQAPPPGAYQQPQQGYQQAPGADPAGTITLNYWLSVFFTWIPALIFYLIEKNKGNTPSFPFHVANLNFSLIRTGVGVVGWILGMIPYIGWLLALLLWIGSVVLFVFHIIAAVKAPDAYRRGGQPEFIFNYPLIK